MLLPLLHEQLARVVRWCHQKHEKHDRHFHEQRTHVEAVVEEEVQQRHDLDRRLSGFAARTTSVVRRQQQQSHSPATASVLADQ